MKLIGLLAVGLSRAMREIGGLWRCPSASARSRRRSAGKQRERSAGGGDHHELHHLFVHEAEPLQPVDADEIEQRETTEVEGAEAPASPAPRPRLRTAAARASIGMARQLK